jgi:hypothetical protein
VDELHFDRPRDLLDGHAAQVAQPRSRPWNACDNSRVPGASRKSAWSRWTSKRRLVAVVVVVLGALIGTILLFTGPGATSGIAYSITAVVLGVLGLTTPAGSDSGQSGVQGRPAP